MGKFIENVEKIFFSFFSSEKLPKIMNMIIFEKIENSKITLSKKCLLT